jgi:hypothetical protein
MVAGRAQAVRRKTSKKFTDLKAWQSGTSGNRSDLTRHAAVRIAPAVEAALAL